MEPMGTSRSCIRRPLIKRCSGSWSLAAAPVAWLAAGSEIVALARQAAVPDNGQWIPDEAEPEGSLAGLATATAADMGSGWPEREPHDGAGSGCAEPVVVPYRSPSFPAGGDEP